MALIDEITFEARAGDGGAGVVRWRHEKNKEFAGAAGGNGGQGGDVYVRAVRDVNVLARHKSVKIFRAGRGADGANWSRQGKAGDDCTIDLPIGSIIRNLSTGRTIELLEEGQVSKILHGGSGGLGNEYFKASTNVKPEQSTGGQAGEQAMFEVELDLIADAGLVGLPNAGKSTLLNALTNARAKVGAYAFTTLDPHLGAIHGYILADLPGLIEGAAEGKGLGTKFLRHVKRTRMLVHVISLEHERMMEAYRTIRDELTKFDPALALKDELIVLSKADLVDDARLARARQELEKTGRTVIEVSVLDDASTKRLADELLRRLAVGRA
ncbi:MAG: GTPase ObgE [Patescibacteria group bacterium]|nr:GTPase ObgE [Patescibacteria group bacterium]MDE2172885.1 GTPase ObgE [Patescibacteria group bacterium]